MENGEDEEEDALEESFEEDKTIKLRNNSRPPEGRAPTMTIEAVRVGRPLKVLSFLTGVVSLLLSVMGVVSTSWAFTEKNRMGLFQNCKRLPKDTLNAMDQSEICTLLPQESWERWISAALGSSAILFTLLATAFLISGMLTLVVKRKACLYRTVIVLHVFSCLLMLTTVVLFPLSGYIRQTNPPQPEQAIETIGWSYIVSACSICTSIVAIILLLLDIKAEEVVYRETII